MYGILVGETVGEFCSTTGGSRGRWGASVVGIVCEVTGIGISVGFWLGFIDGLVGLSF